MWRWFPLLVLPLLAACASHAPAPVVERGAAAPTAATAPVDTAGLYTVKKGDTLWSIALQHDRDYKDLAAWNYIDNPNHISVGQQLRIEPPEAASPVAVAKPVAAAGKVEARPLGETAANNDFLKRQPRGGKIAYSEQALAQAQAMDGTPAATPADKPAAADKPADKAADKPADKPVAKPAATPADKPADKAADKPADKPVAKPAEVLAADEVDWTWPTGGQVIGQFVDAAPGKEANKGIDLAGRLGDPIRGAAAGKVTYVGNLRGYGDFLVVRHSGDFISVYANTGKILVKKDQAIAKGQKIAEIGNSDADRPKLHFEIRRQGKPVDPMKFLPAR